MVVSNVLERLGQSNALVGFRNLNGRDPLPLCLPAPTMSIIRIGTYSVKSTSRIYARLSRGIGMLRLPEEPIRCMMVVLDLGGRMAMAESTAMARKKAETSKKPGK